MDHRIAGKESFCFLLKSSIGQLSLTNVEDEQKSMSLCQVKLSQVVWTVSHIFLVETDLFIRRSANRGNRKGQTALRACRI